MLLTPDLYRQMATVSLHNTHLDELGAFGTVHLMCRGPNLERRMSQYLVSRIERTANVRVHTECTGCEIQGRDRLEVATIISRRGELQQFRVTGLFVMIGAEPGTDWLRDTIQLDDKGFVLTGSNATGPDASAVSPFQTSLPGVFAVGDVRSGSVKRVASAVGEGSVVVSSIHRHLTDGQPLVIPQAPLQGVTP